MKHIQYYINRIEEQRLKGLISPSSFTELKDLFATFQESLTSSDSVSLARSKLMVRLWELIQQSDKFNILGMGSYGLAFQPNSRSYAVKIWIADPAYDFTVRVIAANQNKPGILLPKLRFPPRVLFTTPSGEKLCCLVMEPLTEISQTEFNQKIRFLYYIISDQETFKLPDKSEIADYIRKQVNWYYNNHNDPIFRVFDKDVQIKSGLEFLDQIYPTLTLFVPSGFDWDLHRGNFMKRADGTIVVTDPIAGDS